MFDLGIKVREIATGDIGTITGPHARGGTWWVKWETEPDAGKEYHIAQHEIEVFDDSKAEPPSTIAECIKLLIDAGYTVTKN